MQAVAHDGAIMVNHDRTIPARVDHGMAPTRWEFGIGNWNGPIIRGPFPLNVSESILSSPGRLATKIFCDFERLRTRADHGHEPH